MVVRPDQKLNRLQHELPDGLVVDAGWLSDHGYSSSLRNHYVAAGWLENPARRVYRRPNPNRPLTWEQVMVSLQSLMNVPLVVGGRTAIEMQGYGHYISHNTREVHLYGPSRPPAWLQDLKLDIVFRYHNSLRLFPRSPADQEAHEASRKPQPPMAGMFMVGPGGGVVRPVTMSSLERAVLELLDELPSHESFHQVDMLMEGLTNLSPARLQELLTDCRSVKVKRLFFFFADRHQHAWRKRIDESKIDLGSGNRVLVKGGRLDRRYHITVPEDLDGAA